jgi:hypothetical protein
MLLEEVKKQWPLAVEEVQVLLGVVVVVLRVLRVVDWEFLGG